MISRLLMSLEMRDSCFGCGNCVLTCPSDALVQEEVRPREVIRVT